MEAPIVIIDKLRTELRIKTRNYENKIKECEKENIELRRRLETIKKLFGFVAMIYAGDTLTIKIMDKAKWEEVANAIKG